MIIETQFNIGQDVWMVDVCYPPRDCKYCGGEMPIEKKHPRQVAVKAIIYNLMGHNELTYSCKPLGSKRTATTAFDNETFATREEAKAYILQEGK